MVWGNLKYPVSTTNREDKCALKRLLISKDVSVRTIAKNLLLICRKEEEMIFYHQRMVSIGDMNLCCE